jgi:hypothetical protein
MTHASRRFTALLFTAALLAGCGGTYQVARAPGNAGSSSDFARAERDCNQRNAFVMANPEDAKQTIYLTDAFRDCMASKGWNYSRTERKLWPAKQAGI